MTSRSFSGNTRLEPLAFKAISLVSGHLNRLRLSSHTIASPWWELRAIAPADCGTTAMHE
jgi:hypothetical protein